jgi:hypothetical protein
VWKYVKGWLKTLGEEGIEGVWKRIKTASQEALDWIKEKGGAAWDWVKWAATGIGNIIDALNDLIYWAKVLIDDLKDIGNIWDDFSSSILADMESIGKAWMEYMVNPIKAAKDMGTKLGEVLYGKSVLPDTIQWLGKTGTAVDSVSGKLHDMLQMGLQPAFIDSAALIPGGRTQFAMSSQALLNQARGLSQRPPMAAETRAQERQAMPEEIVLVMEKQEIGRFTSRITREQEGQNKFTFKVNP